MMTENMETRTRERKKKNARGKLILLALLVVILLVGGIFACNAIVGEKPLPIVYQKSDALLVYTGNTKAPIVVSENFVGGSVQLIQDGKGIVYTDATGVLSYSSIKSEKSAKKTKVLADMVYSFIATDDAHIFYIKGDQLFMHDLKQEKALATGVTDMLATRDGRYVFFNTATDLFGIDTKNDTPPIRISESASVYNLLHTAEDWTLESEHLYYLSDGKFARINENLTETILCENAAIGFVLDGSVYAVTETQIDEDVFKTAIVRFDGTEPIQVATDILGTEAVSQLYPGKKYMLFTKQAENNAEKESYYTLDAKGNFRYLCDNDSFINIFTGDSGKELFIHAKDAALYEYRLTGKAEINEKSKKLVAEKVTRAYAVGDHIGITGDLTFGIYHNGEYEAVYDDGQPHYPRLLVKDDKAYICDQSGTAPFYVCKNGKLKQADTGVVNYTLIPGKRIAYLKTEDTTLESWDLYKIDGNKKPVLIDSDVTILF